MLASRYYHTLDITQLRVMHRLTGRRVFEEAADRFQAYMDSRSNRFHASCLRQEGHLQAPALLKASMRSVFLVGGARPNFMKIAPLYHAFRRSPAFGVTLVNTGQHHDDRMAGSFFRELGLPQPDVALDVRSGSHGTQTARIIERFEQELIVRQPDLVVVVGDVNSTIACALTASKVKYLAHNQGLCP
jgi:hypothetical protein